MATTPASGSSPGRRRAEHLLDEAGKRHFVLDARLPYSRARILTDEAGRTARGTALSARGVGGVASADQSLPPELKDRANIRLRLAAGAYATAAALSVLTELWMMRAGRPETWVWTPAQVKDAVFFGSASVVLTLAFIALLSLKQFEPCTERLLGYVFWVITTHVFVCEKGLELDFVKVLDFGLAKHVTPDPSEERLTIEGGIAGTPGYMSPGAAMSHEVDLRSDI